MTIAVDLGREQQNNQYKQAYRMDNKYIRWKHLLMVRMRSYSMTDCIHYFPGVHHLLDENKSQIIPDFPLDFEQRCNKTVLHGRILRRYTPPPLKNHQNIVFHSNTSPDPLKKITKLPTHHSKFCHNRPASKFAGGPMMARI